VADRSAKQSVLVVVTCQSGHQASGENKNNCFYFDFVKVLEMAFVLSLVGCERRLGQPCGTRLFQVYYSRQTANMAAVWCGMNIHPPNTSQRFVLKE